ncbi:DUF6777 domain-containing protein [Streptomyces cinerochromogenes]|uniref:DUF6777 domain-containing protein n=1 Tax=Streptomyces cinerochromogenes TaxID=66422 RepID=UPI00198D6677|nr:DUF6777 domain-containing protein [Streptomyces cinerochromogenes]GGS70397.1 hypothetical protein GCM10010206_35980 [Streptomyces cinerochromogenes]
MRIPTRSIPTVCALIMALLAAGCAGSGVKQTRTGELVWLQAAGERGPEPFTEPTDTGAFRTGSPRSTARVQSGDVEAPLRATRSVSGATPGLYRGTPRVAGCDVERHVRYLAADEAKAEAFAQAAGVPRSALPGYLRGLTPVVLGADTRVTSHAYRDGRAARYQAVLQAGTAVLVDDRGLPRVRCACGNPLEPPAPTRGGAGARGTPWAGYRPNQVVVVTPASRPVTSITLVDAAGRTWIERRIGPDVRRDRVVPPPAPATATPATPHPATTAPATTGAATTPGPAGPAPGATGTGPAGPGPPGPAPTGTALAAPGTDPGAAPRTAPGTASGAAPADRLADQVE